MSKPTDSLTVTIKKVERLPNSVNGNPKWRFRCVTPSGERRNFHTGKDAQLGLLVTTGWEGGRAVFTTNGARTVLAVRFL